MQKKFIYCVKNRYIEVNEHTIRSRVDPFKVPHNEWNIQKGLIRNTKKNYLPHADEFLGLSTYRFTIIGGGL